MVDGRRQRGAKTRARLIDAALQVIVVDGTDAVTQRKVASLAGTSLASTTYHFPTASELLVAAFEEAVRRSSDEFAVLSAAVLGGELELVEAAAVFAARAPFGAGFAPDALPELFMAAAHRPALRPIAAAYLDQLAAAFAPFTDPPEAAATVARALTGLIIHEMQRGGERPSETFRTDLTRLFDAFGVTERLTEATTNRRPGTEDPP